MNRIMSGDALTVLRTLESESVQCCVTSPPYWGLRDYGVQGQLGLEKTPEEYVVRVTAGKLKDPTLTFQLKEGFEVLGVVSGYLHYDAESLGYAAVIEWINRQVAKAEDYAGRNPRFLRQCASSQGHSHTGNHG